MQLPYRLGRYTLVEKIAAGGTAEIYRAVQSADGGFAKTVAVKRLLPAWGGNDEVAAMLADEARALMYLPHRAIVQVLEYGCADGAPFLAMEFVDGIDVARLLTDLVRDRSRLAPALAIHIVGQVLFALEVAHRTAGVDGRPLGIVHRDISPANILLSWNGEVKVTDFGIAKGTHRTRMTEIGQLKGKYAYMAPEQARGEPIDLRADLFACGIVLWELVCGRRRFEGATDIEILERVQRAEAPGGEIAYLSPELRTVLTLALAPDREQRYRSAAEMLRDLRFAVRAAGDAAGDLELASFLRERYPPEHRRSFTPIVVQPTAGVVTTRILEPTPQVRPGGRWMQRVRAAMMAIMLMALGAVSPGKEAISGVNADAPPALRPSAVSGTHGERERSQAQGDSTSVRAEPVEARTPLPPIAGGVVVIDSDPPRAAGTLVIDGRPRRIRTPFALDGIALGEGVAGSVELEAPGYRRTAASFRLDGSQPAFVKRIALAREMPAAISVQAQPWGLVDIAGVAAGRETPVTNVKLKAGVYAVTVRHPPSGHVVSTRVVLASGASRRCLATFGDAAKLTCR